MMMCSTHIWYGIYDTYIGNRTQSFYTLTLVWEHKNLMLVEQSSPSNKTTWD